LSPFEHDLHMIVLDCLTVTSMVLYGLVRLNTIFIRNLQGEQTIPPTFVQVMVESTHACMF